jgi:LAO/AO transport system kinase
MREDLKELWSRARGGDLEATRSLFSSLHAGGPEREALVEMVHPLTGHAHRVGFAGPTGVGKSTLLEGLSRLWRDESITVGLVTSSPAAREVNLGEGLKLLELAQEEGTLLHALPAELEPRERNLAAGLVADAMEALGCDPILLEAPGLGPNEVELIRRSHTIVLVLSPDPATLDLILSGPWIDGADLVVLNHCEREGAQEVAARLKERLQVSANDRPLLLTQANHGLGLSELGAALHAHAESLRQGGGYELRRRSGLRAQLRMLTEERLLGTLWQDADLSRTLDELAEDVAHLRTDPESAAARLAKWIRGKQ